MLSAYTTPYYEEVFGLRNQCAKTSLVGSYGMLWPTISEGNTRSTPTKDCIRCMNTKNRREATKDTKDKLMCENARARWCISTLNLWKKKERHSSHAEASTNNYKRICYYRILCSLTFFGARHQQESHRLKMCQVIFRGILYTHSGQAAGVKLNIAAMVTEETLTQSNQYSVAITESFWRASNAAVDG